MNSLGLDPLGAPSTSLRRRRNVQEKGSRVQALATKFDGTVPGSYSKGQEKYVHGRIISDEPINGCVNIIHDGTTHDDITHDGTTTPMVASCGGIIP